MIDKTIKVKCMNVKVDMQGMDKFKDLIIATKEYMLAVNLLVDRIDCMIEEDEVDIDKLQKRVNVVNKFKKNLERTIDNQNSR